MNGLLESFDTLFIWSVMLFLSVGLIASFIKFVIYCYVKKYLTDYWRKLEFKECFVNSLNQTDEDMKRFHFVINEVPTLVSNFYIKVLIIFLKYLDKIEHIGMNFMFALLALAFLLHI